MSPIIGGSTPPGVGTTTTATLTNKRITRRSVTYNAPGGTPSIDTDNYDIVLLTGLNTPITSMTSGLSGTPRVGDSIIICFTDNGTSRTIAWGTSFLSTTVLLPGATVGGVRLTVGFLWDAVAIQWACVGVA